MADKGRETFGKDVVSHELTVQLNLSSRPEEGGGRGSRNKMLSKCFTNGFSGRGATFMTVILREIPTALKT